MTKTEQDNLNKILAEAQDVRSGLRAISKFQETSDYEGDDLFTLIDWAVDKLGEVNSALDEMLTDAEHETIAEKADKLISSSLQED